MWRNLALYLPLAFNKANTLLHCVKNHILHRNACYQISKSQILNNIFNLLLIASVTSSFKFFSPKTGIFYIIFAQSIRTIFKFPFCNNFLKFTLYLSRIYLFQISRCKGYLWPKIEDTFISMINCAYLKFK